MLVRVWRISICGVSTTHTSVPHTSVQGLSGNKTHTSVYTVTNAHIHTHTQVFYLKDLKEVSEQTNDAVKFVCDHEVMPHSDESPPLRQSLRTTRAALCGGAVLSQ